MNIRTPELEETAAGQSVRPEEDEAGVPGADDGGCVEPPQHPPRQLVQAMQGMRVLRVSLRRDTHESDGPRRCLRISFHLFSAIRR